MNHYNKPNEMDDTDKEINGTDETCTADSNDVEIATTKASEDPTPPSNNDGEPLKKKRVPLRVRLARLKRRKAVDDEDALFGRSVASLVDGDKLTLNPQLMWLMRILEDEGPTAVGIFRRSSNANICRTVKTQLNSGIKSDQVNVYVASTLFKELLRCLPDCLLCCDKYDQWLEKVQDKEHLQRMVNELPQCNRLLLRHVIRVLHAIHRNSDVTKMTSHNLAVCVGPSLLWSRKATLDSQKADVPRVVAVIQGMIEDAEFIFGPDFLEPVQDSANERNTREPDTINSTEISVASSRDQLDNDSDDSESENYVDPETRDRRHVVSTDNEALEDSGSYEEEEPDAIEWQRHRLSRSFDPPTPERSADEGNSIVSHPCVKKSPKNSAGDSDNCEAAPVHESEAVKRKFMRRLAIRRTFGELLSENIKHSSNDDLQRRLGCCSDGPGSDPAPPSPIGLPSEPSTNKAHSPEAFAKASERQSEGTKQKFVADSFNSTARYSDTDLPTCEEPTNTVVSSKVKPYENACSNDRSVDGATGCRQRRGMTGKGSDLFPGVFLSDAFRLKSALSLSLNELDHEMNGDADKGSSSRNFRQCGTLPMDERAEKKVCYDSDLDRRKFECRDGRQWDSDIGESSSKRDGRADNTASDPYRSHVNSTAAKFSWKEEASTPNNDQSATKLQRSKKEIETEKEDVKAIVGVTSKPAETREVISRSHVSSSSSSDDDQELVSNRHEYNRANRVRQSREDTLHDSQASRFRSKSDSNAVFITRLVIRNDLTEPPLSDQRKAGFNGTASSSSDSSSEDQLDERIRGRGETLNPTDGNRANTVDNYQNLTEMLSAIPARSRRPVAMIDPAWDHTERVSSAGNNTDGPVPTWSGGRQGKSTEDVFRDRPADEPVARTRTNASSNVVSTLVEPNLVKDESNVLEALRNVAPRVNLVLLRKNELESKPTNARKSSNSTQNRKVLARCLDDCNSSPPVGVSAKKSGPFNEKERLISGGKDLARKDGRSFPAAKRAPSIKGNANESTSRVNPRTRHPNAKTNDTSRDGQLPSSRPLETAKRSQHTGKPVAQDSRSAISPPLKIRLPESTGNSAPPGDKTESLRSQPRRTVSRSVSLGQPKTPSTRLPMQVNHPVIPEVSRRTRSGLRTRRDPGQTTKNRANPDKSSPGNNPSQPLTGVGDISGTTARAGDKPLGRPSKTNADGLKLRPIRPSAFASARSIESPQENHLSLFPQTPEAAASSAKRREFSTKSDAKRQNPVVQTANNHRRIKLIQPEPPKYQRNLRGSGVPRNLI